MSETGLLTLAVKSPARLLERMTADLTDEQLHWNPPGTAHSVAATWAHAIVSTDWQIQFAEEDWPNIAFTKTKEHA